MILDEDQQRAVALLNTEFLGVVTGGPGTGKTTILRNFLSNSLEEQVVLLAPTGRAARRIAEVTGCTASTVHRWLAKDGVASLPSRAVIIIDEASMLDVECLALLLDSIGSGIMSGRGPGEVGAGKDCVLRLFFLGDVDQLPSVGPGNVLSDLIESGALPVVRLDRVYRSKEDSWVANAAPAIMRGEFPFVLGPGFHFIEAEADLVQKLVDVTLTEKAKSTLPLVLVPQNVGDCGAAALNSALQARLNPGDADSFSVQAVQGMRHHIKVGDRVIATVNDYTRLIFNGETGVVENIEGRGDGSVEVRFDGGPTHTYSKTEASETLRLAYALTVHKAQGSEAKTVILVASMEHSYMLTRRLFYTAVTRAQERVVIVGQREAIEHAVTNTAETERVTTLRERICDGR